MYLQDKLGMGTWGWMLRQKYERIVPGILDLQIKYIFAQISFVFSQPLFGKVVDVRKNN